MIRPNEGAMLQSVLRHDFPVTDEIGGAAGDRTGGRSDWARFFGRNFAKFSIDNLSYQVQGFSFGNPNLVPETANTTAAGIDYRPSWFPGFGSSLDYCDIKINGVINSLSAQETYDRCQAGSPRPTA